MRRSLFLITPLSLVAAHAAVADPLPGGSLDPAGIPKYVEPLIIPPVMPRTGTINQQGGPKIDYYEIAVRQFQQHILPPQMGIDPTTVWSYGSVNHPGTFNYPAFTIEAKWKHPVRVKWINDLVNANGDYLPHLLPVDQTLHWANPAGPRDARGFDPMPYTGPVPIVTHVHGAETGPESDGYPEAWYMPAAINFPGDILFTTGSLYDQYKAQAEGLFGQTWQPGTAVFQYPNEQAAATLWYHDHTLGMTRLNVYAGPAGFYLLRGGPGDDVKGKLPGPAPKPNDPPGKKYGEIPIAIQDRSFNDDGSLFYPSDRAFFEGLEPGELQIPFIPEQAEGGMSDISPIWNPEFFGNTIVVNGRTWPYLQVQPKRYRLRLLNGCNSRFLILAFDTELSFVQIGGDGGFLPDPVELDRVLMGPAERADVIVDFSGFSDGAEITMINLAPDEPFGGGVPGEDFDPADPQTTGQVMRFVVTGDPENDNSMPGMNLRLPEPEALPAVDNTRQVSLNEEDSSTVFVVQENGNIVFDPDGEPFGPKAALLGLVDGDEGEGLLWGDVITENPALGSTEIWEIYNFTADAHPIHLHLVQFEIVNRQTEDGQVYGPEPGELGRKDTVIAYPGEITRIKACFSMMGLYVWHCHILEHEDNEMMRPYFVGPMVP